MDTARFEDLGLRPELLHGLGRLGFAIPTPIQLAAWGPVKAGQDVIMQAPTGTGKTLAYGLPLLERIAGTPLHPRVLILAPTRELALQIRDDLREVARRWRPAIHAAVGGEPVAAQLKAMKDGVAVLVGTPGRVRDLMQRGSLVWKHAHTLVLDEVDELLQGGFAADLAAIQALLPEPMQTVLASATVGPEIAAFAEARLPEAVRLGAVSEAPQAALTLRHRLALAPRNAKPTLLLRLLGRLEGQVLLFVARREETRRLALKLREAGFAAGYLSGELPLENRRATLARFEDGTYRILVATDVAGRGLDLPSVEHVIHYSVPVNVEQYVHRAGRAGRAGRPGTVYTLSYREESEELKRLKGAIAFETLELPSGSTRRGEPWRPPVEDEPEPQERGPASRPHIRPDEVRGKARKHGAERGRR